MAAVAGRVFTVAPGVSCLDALARAVLTGEFAKGELALQQDFTNLLGDLGGEFAREAETQRIEQDALRQTLILRQAREAQLIDKRRFAQIEIAIEQERLRRLEELRRADRELALKSAGAAFGELAGLTKEAVGEQSAAYKALFAVHKAFAIAEAVINIQRAIASALASGATLGEKIAAVATVVAQAASIVSTIRSVSMAFADGGYVIGPGGPRDDRILARLSAGEYVVNARATVAMDLRMDRAETLSDELFIIQMMGDDRAISQTYISGIAQKAT